MQHPHQTPSLERWFFLAVAGFVVYLFWSIIQPYALVLMTAAITVVVLSPLERRLNSLLKHAHVSAAIMALGVIALVFVPMIVLLFVMANQARDLITQSLIDQGWVDGVRSLMTPLVSLFPQSVQSYLLSYDLNEVRSAIGTWAFDNIGALFASTTGFLLNAFLYFLALYYLMIDRDKLAKTLIELSPFQDHLDNELLHKMISTVRSVVFGVLLLAIIQGTLAGVGMTIFGVPGALIWGAVTMVAALIPFVGTAIVLIPAIAYLFFIGAQGAGIGLLIWSVVFVGLADNVIGPLLIKGTTNMHVFLILLSVLGGLQTYGAIGAIIGPTILAAFLTLIELYQSRTFIKKQKNTSSS